MDDIDLWVGGLLEPKAPGSILGITFRDIVAEQFARLKRGDKYFFDHDPSINPGHFTPGEWKTIKWDCLVDSCVFSSSPGAQKGDHVEVNL